MASSAKYDPKFTGATSYGSQVQQPMQAQPMATGMRNQGIDPVVEYKYVVIAEKHLPANENEYIYAELGLGESTPLNTLTKFTNLNFDKNAVKTPAGQPTQIAFNATPSLPPMAPYNATQQAYTNSAPYNPQQQAYNPNAAPYNGQQQPYGGQPPYGGQQQAYGAQIPFNQLPQAQAQNGKPAFSALPQLPPMPVPSASANSSNAPAYALPTAAELAEKQAAAKKELENVKKADCIIIDDSVDRAQKYEMYKNANPNAIWICIATSRKTPDLNLSGPGGAAANAIPLYEKRYIADCIHDILIIFLENKWDHCEIDRRSAVVPKYIFAKIIAKIEQPAFKSYLQALEAQYSSGDVVLITKKVLYAIEDEFTDTLKLLKTWRECATVDEDESE